jgi:prepilin-type N-terminal cleavage/methylation domain-containing protein
MNINQQPTQSFDAKGFTIVEVLVTMGVLSVFLFGFFQTYLLLESQRINVSRQAKASDIAYSNLRKVTTRPGGLTCDTQGVPVTITQEPASAGIISQDVVAFPTNGCSGTNFTDNPVKIVSTVTYGTNGGSVTHASFVQ